MPKQTLKKAILGTSNGSDIWCISRAGWLISHQLKGLNKSFLMTIKDRIFWRHNVFRHANATDKTKDPVDWDKAIDDVIGFSNKEFDIENVKGCGAWRDNETGEICYHNGNTEKILGIPSPKWFLAKRRKKDIGLESPHMKPSVRAKILDTVFKLPFSTKREAAGYLSWVTISNFCGAIDFRTICMITGSSGSGKSSIFDRVAAPIIGDSMFDVTGGTTEAGIRQNTSIDSRPVVVDELEDDTPKNREVRDGIFALARMSTQNNSPKMVKGGKDGSSQSFNTRGMFLFMGISPNVTKTADENRMFTCNVVGQKKGESDRNWPKNRDTLKELLTTESCKGLRALTWDRLNKIIEVSRDLIPLIEDETKLDARFATKESIVLATHIVVWLNIKNPSKAEMQAEVKVFYADFEKEVRDETKEFVDTILDTEIRVEELKGSYTFRQLLMMVQSGFILGYADPLNKMEKGEDAKDKSYKVDIETMSVLKRVLFNHGIALAPTRCGINAVGFRESATLMRKLENVNKGYIDTIKRHDNMVVIEKDKTHPIGVLGDQKRYVVIEGLLKCEEE